jgi:hypothetical protein
MEESAAKALVVPKGLMLVVDGPPNGFRGTTGAGVAFPVRKGAVDVPKGGGAVPGEGPNVGALDEAAKDVVPNGGATPLGTNGEAFADNPNDAAAGGGANDGGLPKAGAFELPNGDGGGS